MIYILNELSLKKFDTAHSAKIALERFIITSVNAKEIGFDELRFHQSIGKNLYNFELSDNYFVQHWLKDNEVNNDLKDKFRELLTISPLVSYDEIKELDWFNRSEFKISVNKQHLDAYGLGVAFLFDTLSISFLSDSFWNVPTIDISHYFLDENSNEKIENQTVRHISIPEHISIHKKWVEQKQKDSLENSRSLWLYRLEFFPDLVLCGEVEQQLTKIGFSKYLYQIIDKLKELNKYAKNWKSGDFDTNDVNANYSLNISPETQQTMRKYGNQRRFKLPKEIKKPLNFTLKPVI